MTLLALSPVAIAAALWILLWRINKRRRWFTVGEVLFWDAIILIIAQLVWLRWF